MDSPLVKTSTLWGQRKHITARRGIDSTHWVNFSTPMVVYLRLGWKSPVRLVNPPDPAGYFWICSPNGKVIPLSTPLWLPKIPGKIRKILPGNPSKRQFCGPQ